MKNHLKAISLLLLLAPAPALAQQGLPGSGGAPANAATGPNGLSLGQDASKPRIGESYARGTVGDWQIRCVKTASGKDPCRLFQVLRDQAGNSVAEINLFPVPGGQQVVAGATIVTPLETLLTQQLTLSVDGAAGKRYPFAWCAKIGCFSRIGFTAADLTAFRRGTAAEVMIVPAKAPTRKVLLKLSLKGFTKAFASLSALVKSDAKKPTKPAKK